MRLNAIAIREALVSPSSDRFVHIVTRPNEKGDLKCCCLTYIAVLHITVLNDGDLTIAFRNV